MPRILCIDYGKKRTGIAVTDPLKIIASALTTVETKNIFSFLKKYFRQNKKYGSRDRRQISHLCYCYFRVGKALLNIPIEERVLIGLFLCSDRPNEMIELLKPEWNEKVDLPVKEKLLIITAQLRQSVGNHLLSIDIFPWKEELGEGIDHEKFCESFFIQPDLFIRLRPGYANEVKTKLLGQEINFSEISPGCLSLPNGSRIENIIELDSEAVVQDLNSQQTGFFLKSFKPEISNLKLKIWDCCAASGGKSLMLNDIDPDIELTVSDIRESALNNLKKRFAKAGIKNYKSFVTDLTQLNFKSQISNFELIICDAPCTGSGTWSRTPEQLYFFNEKKIEQYALLQKKIVANIIPQLKKDGCLLYITCSVFKKENEEVVEFIQSNSDLELIKMELLKGYDKKADTMFVALFKKNS
jgi:16S rRNA (cytosine967-C5)-methyltransferase